MTSGHRRIQPRKRPRQARAEQTRQRILDAAAHVFADYGYAAGTTNRIAEQAGISIGSLYQYYPNKDAILAELMARHLDAGVAASGLRAGQEISGSLEDIVRRGVRVAIANHFDDPQLLRIMAEQAPRPPELIEVASRFERDLVAYTRHLLTHHPEVRVENTYVAARLVVSTVELVVHQLVASPEPVELPQLEDELVAMLTRYLTGATQDRPDRSELPPPAEPPADSGKAPTEPDSAPYDASP